MEDLLDERYAIIGCRGGDNPSIWWDINIGVLFGTRNGHGGHPRPESGRAAFEAAAHMLIHLPLRMTVNLQHPDFGEIISMWLSDIEAVPEARMQDGSTESFVGMVGAQPVPDDQQMFHQIIEKYGPVKGPRIVKRYEDGEEAVLFNYREGKYVAHIIRADNKDQKARLAALLGIKATFFARLAELEAERAMARHAFVYQMYSNWSMSTGHPSVTVP